MPFGLKNVGATYQRAMNAIFHELIGDMVELYIDDIIVKSKVTSHHLSHLCRAFLCMRAHKLKLNPLKCAFDVSACNFLGFLASQRGIEVDQNKTKAMIEVMPPCNKKELQRFLSQVNYIRRFISNCADRTQVFSLLLKLKKEDEFLWREEHQKSFEDIKRYLVNPLVLNSPIRNRPLKLYLSATDTCVACLLPHSCHLHSCLVMQRFYFSSSNEMTQYTLTSQDTAITSFSHDKVLAAAADAAFKVSFNQKKKQDTTKPGILGCLAKSFKGCKPDQNLDASQMCHTGNFSHLEGLFAKPPAFPDSTSREPPQPESDSSSLPPPIKSEKAEELSIDDIVIDDLSPPLPQPMTTTSKQPKKEKRGTISYQPFSHYIEHC
ncbi:unnamed protein product [Linum trigynum]|uniref:Reverse transcriptase domain-containing protein n=1 Tax=Linum trigynum TaxID=586398 RepID=A0AAV2FW49_9ROSI